MRIFEIVNAEDQLELWKLISTSVWQQMQQKVEDQQKRLSAQAIKKKLNPKAKNKGGAKLPLPPKPKAPTPKGPAQFKQTPQQFHQSMPAKLVTPVRQPITIAPPQAAPSAPKKAVVAMPAQAPAQPTAQKQPAQPLSNPLNSVKTVDKRVGYAQK